MFHDRCRFYTFPSRSPQVADFCWDTFKLRVLTFPPPPSKPGAGVSPRTICTRFSDKFPFSPPIGTLKGRGISRLSFCSPAISELQIDWPFPSLFFLGGITWDLLVPAAREPPPCRRKHFSLSWNPPFPFFPLSLRRNPAKDFFRSVVFFPPFPILDFGPSGPYFLGLVIPGVFAGPPPLFRTPLQGPKLPIGVTRPLSPCRSVHIPFFRRTAALLPFQLP